jgi:hypothetical protein
MEYNFKEFKMETLHEQIKLGRVDIQFQTKNLKVHVHGGHGIDGRPDKWTVFAVYEEAGKPKRTQSRILLPKDAEKELERAVQTAISMITSRAPLDGN